MSANRVYQKTTRTPQELAELRAIREKYQDEKPSLEQAIIESGETHAVPLGAVLLLHELFAGLKKLREQQG